MTPPLFKESSIVVNAPVGSRVDHLHLKKNFNVAAVTSDIWTGDSRCAFVQPNLMGMG